MGDNRLPAATRMGAVALTVTDLDRSLAYYQARIGLTWRRDEGETAVLGTPQHDLLHLIPQPDAQPAPHRTTGLYHFALLLPSRLELARRLYLLAHSQTPFVGFADHGVSEALYLQDPDGHGIEIYRDRPRTQWRYGSNGQLQMGTDPLDSDDLLAELTVDPQPGPVDAAAVLGHMHLHVADLAAAERFYTDLIGFDLVMRYGGAASFLSAGGYHHHLGINTWAGVGASPPPPTAVQMQWYEIRLPAAALAAVQQRLADQQYSFRVENGTVWVKDPSHNKIRLAPDEG